jgi:hypothetical protein
LPIKLTGYLLIRIFGFLLILLSTAIVLASNGISSNQLFSLHCFCVEMAYTFCSNGTMECLQGHAPVHEKYLQTKEMLWIKNILVCRDKRIITRYLSVPKSRLLSKAVAPKKWKWRSNCKPG